jgi:hypothetical protein
MTALALALALRRPQVGADIYRCRQATTKLPESRDADDEIG